LNDTPIDPATPAWPFRSAATGRAPARALVCARCEQGCDAGATTKNAWGQHLCAACHAQAIAEAGAPASPAPRRKPR
jgi:hypothetical protein